MRFGSICSGIEAASVAFAPLGWTAAWFAEIDAFPAAVLAHHYASVPNLGDMTQVADRISRGEVEAPDLLCGGTPCQSFSVAGLRRSLNDARGNLSLEFIRIADATDRVRRAAGKREAYVLWENVPGVLSTNDNAFGSFLGGLCGGDSALDAPANGWPSAGVVDGPSRVVAWRVLDAQFFGLAQRRKRVFVLALGGAGKWACADALLPVTESMSRHSAPRREARSGAAAGTLRSTDGGSDVDHAQAGHLAFGGNNTSGPIDVAAGLNAHGGAGRMDFETETFIAHALQTTCNDYSRADGFNMVAHALTGEGFDASEDGTGRGTPLVAHAFDARQSDVIQYGEKTGPLDTDGHTTGVLAFSCKDHGSDATDELREEVRVMDVVGALNSAPDVKRGSGTVLNQASVRRLTPLECERLQGFPDGYTAIPSSKRNAAAEEAEMRAYYLRTGQAVTEEHIRRMAADGPRYKALGNSWAVPCARWIGQRIAMVDSLQRKR